MSNKNQETIQNPNAAIEHTRGGSTTRDATDLGVPMLPEDPSQPKRVGPEDAADPNIPTRGDYTGRLGGVNSHQVTADPDAPLGERIGRIEKQKAPRIGE